MLEQIYSLIGGWPIVIVLCGSFLFGLWLNKQMEKQGKAERKRKR